MSRLIDADELHKQLEDVLRYDQYSVYHKVYELIDKQPTIDPWHYPRKGEYPKEDEEVLIRIDKKNYLGTYDGEVMWHIPLAEIVCSGDWVDCWQYIELPKRRRNNATLAL